MNSYERTFYELNNLYCEGRDDGRKSARKAAELRGVEAEAGALAYALERGSPGTMTARCLPPDLELAEDDALTDRETATILAALRMYQRHPTSGIAMHGETLSIEDIDDLCERLNLSPHVRLEGG